MFHFRTILFILIIFIYKSSFGNVNQERILKYLQNFDSLSSDFIQVNNNGSVLTGKLFISRPGMVRVEYNEIPLLLISDNKKMASVNKDLDSITFYRIQDICLYAQIFQGIILVLNNQLILQYFFFLHLKLLIEKFQHVYDF